jgi:uncharacterized protein YpbB
MKRRNFYIPVIEEKKIAHFIKEVCKTYKKVKDYRDRFIPEFVDEPKEPIN